MSLPIRLRRAARKEFLDSAEWYEQRGAGLGGRFVEAVDATLADVAENPMRYPEVIEGIREALVCGWPFCIYYREEMEEVVVLAVYHSARDPSGWQSRM